MKKIKKNSGFTLIEVLVALVILTGSMIIISNIWSGNKRRVNKISDYHKIVQLMEQKISELEFEWQRKNFSSIPKEEKGTFNEEKYFSWSVKTKSLILPNPVELMNLAEQSQEIVTQVAEITTQFLSEAILEAKLTIHYKRGDLKSDYSLTTYIIDHHKEIEISTPPSVGP